MFKVENLDQINSLTYKPIDRKNKYKYIIINKQYVDKKYEIGKRLMMGFYIHHHLQLVIIITMIMLPMMKNMLNLRIGKIMTISKLSMNLTSLYKKLFQTLNLRIMYI